MPPLPQNAPVAKPTGANPQLAGTSNAGFANSSSAPLPPIPAAPAPQPAPAPAAPAAPAPQNPSPQPQNTPQGGLTASDGTQLDPSVLKVMGAIRQIESQGDYNAVGDNGASAGAFQWNNAGQKLHSGQIPVNFQNAAKQFGLNPDDFSAANQNHVAYLQIQAYKNQGLSPLEVDALWNGAHFDSATQQYVHNNPQRATEFTQALAQQNASMNGGALPPAPTQPDAEAQITPPAKPSIGGFAENALSSAANFAGNLGDAILHPIKTVEAIGSIPVGALQEAGGQSNANTQNFDNLVSYFNNRWGFSNLLQGKFGAMAKNIGNTLYTDPIGAVADASTLFAGAGGLAGVAAKGAELGGLGDAAAAATEGASMPGEAGFVSDIGATPATEATGATGALLKTSNGLMRASNAINPLTPMINAGMALAEKLSPVADQALGQILNKNSKIVADMRANPQDYSPEAMASVTRSGLSQEVQARFDALDAALSETGSGYDDFKGENAVPISVEPDTLENEIRKYAKVEVKDGTIRPSTTSSLSRAQIAPFQEILNTYKPAFQTGEISSEEFLALRARLSNAAYGINGIKDSDVADIAAQMRHDLNAQYREQVPGLADRDESFSTQKTTFRRLSKGFLDREGNLTDNAVNKIANAANKGKDSDIARLEELMPGITRRIQVMRNIEDFKNVGSGGNALKTLNQEARTGATVYGAFTGNVQVLALGLAADFVSEPEVAAQILRTVAKIKPQVVQPTLNLMSRFALTGAVGAAATTQQQGNISQAEGTPSPSSSPLPGQPSAASTLSAPNTQTEDPPSTNTSPDDTTDLSGAASSAGYDPSSVSDAQNAGYTNAEIMAFLNNQQSQ